jgi:uncharacterized membrane protein YphA (DoxX/SURF4 family)
MNPFTDAISFLTQQQWTIYIFWLLLLGSFGLAAVNLLRDPKQRSGAHVWMWLARLLLGGMWWQQTLWKLPPTFEGLHYWLGQMTQHAAFAWQRAFVQQMVQPHFTLFAALVYAMEVGIAVSLLLGFLTRLGGALGALQALNLWTGLYSSPEEWTWTYIFLLVIQVTFVVFRAGQSLGLDAILARREPAQPRLQGAGRALKWLR